MCKKQEEFEKPLSVKLIDLIEYQEGAIVSRTIIHKKRDRNPFCL